MSAASVWYPPSASSQESSSQKELENSDDDDCCMICTEVLVKESYFVPCGHKCCSHCVLKLRQANVYKAAKGVHCPFCRQLIESFSDAKPAFPKGQRTGTSGALQEVLGKSQAQQAQQWAYGRTQIWSVAEANDYAVPKGCTGQEGGGLRINPTREELPSNYIVPPLKDSADILVMAMDRTGSRHLGWMLREDSPKREKVAKRCLEALTPSIAKLATHMSGNYVCQRLFDVLASNRSITLEKECGFTAVVRSMAANHGMATAAMDQRGTFTLQKMLLLVKGPEEVKLVMDGLRGFWAKLSLDSFGVYVVERVAEVLITALNGVASGPKARAPPVHAAHALGLIVRELTADDSTTRSMAQHQVINNILIECVRWGLPGSNAIGAARQLAKNAGEIAMTKLGNQTIKGLLSFNVPEISEAVVMGLGEKFSVLAMDSANQGTKVVKACIGSPTVSMVSRTRIVYALFHAALMLDGEALDVAHYLDAFAFGICLLPKDTQDRLLSVISVKFGAQRAQAVYTAIYTIRTREPYSRFPPPPSLLNPPSPATTPPELSPAITKQASPVWEAQPSSPPPHSSTNSFPPLNPRTQDATAPSSTVQTFAKQLHQAPSTSSRPHQGPPPLGAGQSVGARLQTAVSNGCAPATSSCSSSEGETHALWGSGTASEGLPPSQSVAEPDRSGMDSLRIGEPPGTRRPTLNAGLAGFADRDLLRLDATSPGSAADLDTPPFLIPDDDDSQLPLGCKERGSVPQAEVGEDRQRSGEARPAPERSGSLGGAKAKGTKKGGRGGGRRLMGMCAVCDADMATVVLLNCSHLCACASCAETLVSCPICHSAIEEKICVQLGPAPVAEPAPPVAPAIPTSPARDPNLPLSLSSQSALTSSATSAAVTSGGVQPVSVMPGFGPISDAAPAMSASTSASTSGPEYQLPPPLATSFPAPRWTPPLSPAADERGPNSSIPAALGFATASSFAPSSSAAYGPFPGHEPNNDQLRPAFTQSGDSIPFAMGARPRPRPYRPPVAAYRPPDVFTNNTQR